MTLSKLCHATLPQEQLDQIAPSLRKAPDTLGVNVATVAEMGYSRQRNLSRIASVLVARILEVAKAGDADRERGPVDQGPGHGRGAHARRGAPHPAEHRRGLQDRRQDAGPAARAADAVAPRAALDGQRHHRLVQRGRGPGRGPRCPRPDSRRQGPPVSAGLHRARRRWRLQVERVRGQGPLRDAGVEGRGRRRRPGERRRGARGARGARGSAAHQGARGGLVHEVPVLRSARPRPEALPGRAADRRAVHSRPRLRRARGGPRARAAAQRRRHRLRRGLEQERGQERQVHAHGQAEGALETSRRVQPLRERRLHHRPDGAELLLRELPRPPVRGHGRATRRHQAARPPLRGRVRR
mmetsp:Transcript_19299/g.57327  ORF Transcript_19299/g.57327 Transcript_19299/m.57327 type:complete len:355 (+) Transcript_19299:554-1618(+)